MIVTFKIACLEEDFRYSICRYTSILTVWEPLNFTLLYTTVDWFFFNRIYWLQCLSFGDLKLLCYTPTSLSVRHPYWCARQYSCILVFHTGQAYHPRTLDFWFSVVLHPCRELTQFKTIQLGTGLEPGWPSTQSTCLDYSTTAVILALLITQAALIITLNSSMSVRLQLGLRST